MKNVEKSRLQSRVSNLTQLYADYTCGVLYPRMEISLTGAFPASLLITAGGVREINYWYLLFERGLIRFDPKAHVAKCAAYYRDYGRAEHVVHTFAFARRSAGRERQREKEEGRLHINLYN